MRPRGNPPTPRARSRAIDPDEMTSNAILSVNSPIFMMEPLPNCRSICARALLRATAFSSAMILRSLGCRDKSDGIAPECHLRGTRFDPAQGRLIESDASFIHPFALADNRTCVRLSLLKRLYLFKLSL